MFAIIFGAIGLLAFVLAAAVLGARLRRGAAKADAERLSRVMHALFFLGLGAPVLVAAATPGIQQLDLLLGLDPLPQRTLRWVLGGLLAVPGIYLLSASSRLLRSRGDGANAFRLTQRVVVASVYTRTRNPMSLGYYLAALSLALLSGSTTLLLYVALGIIPAHLFFLRHFEERELALRLGSDYERYRREVPFLIPRSSARDAV